jgi:hypothetical protein
MMNVNNTISNTGVPISSNRKCKRSRLAGNSALENSKENGTATTISTGCNDWRSFIPSQERSGPKRNNPLV